MQHRLVDGQSKNVRRGCYENPQLLLDSTDEIEGINGHRIEYDSLNLPVNSERAAESLGIQSSFAVTRNPKDSTVPISKVKPKFQIDLAAIKSAPFDELPHPSELFGKSRVKTNKRKRLKLSPVDYHIKQLHEKQARLFSSQNEDKLKNKFEVSRDPSSKDLQTNQDKDLTRTNTLPFRFQKHMYFEE